MKYIYNGTNEDLKSDAGDQKEEGNKEQNCHKGTHTHTQNKAIGKRQK